MSLSTGLRSMVAQGACMYTQSRGVVHTPGLLGYLQSDDRPHRPKPSVHIIPPPGTRPFINSAPELQLIYRTSSLYIPSTRESATPKRWIRNLRIQERGPKWMWSFTFTTHFSGDSGVCLVPLAMSTQYRLIISRRPQLAKCTSLAIKPFIKSISSQDIKQQATLSKWIDEYILGCTKG
ncbi:uncharacterized protein MELLADRAFT_102085 [Melampsora larici-populina 98AG31]|uniref:Uncharacterized protein n=1 Tax=Melampsora larici-populina (strain 98AG31 / pathotype 3-4-7) TaxID=747676 RepID=F4R5Y5_MELLP|nr:uncharacterized protein MELLADRAFT_102085 [Melampsora larici-populina 98AG31]EGG12120.1 hypothetical protein MELLADRAFT_102085 [Melampsora larici-populina 98AG31]